MDHSGKTLSTVCRGAALVLLSAVMIGPALAGDQGEEPALAVEPEDSALTWGPCPAFFGEGCHIAVLHGDPARPDTDVLFRLAGQRAFPAHRHTSAERMVLISGELEVVYEGQEPVRLSAGTYAYGPPGRAHRGKCVSAAPCVLFIAFEQPIDAMQVTME